MKDRTIFAMLSLILVGGWLHAGDASGQIYDGREQIHD